MGFIVSLLMQSGIDISLLTVTVAIYPIHNTIYKHYITNKLLINYNVIDPFYIIREKYMVRV